jgi:hypothetical protein
MADKPREYFDRLWTMPEEDIDYENNPPTTAADWEDAEWLLPIQDEELPAVQAFLAERGLPPIDPADSAATSWDRETFEAVEAFLAELRQRAEAAE